MSVDLRSVTVKQILVRTSGYLQSVCSHSLQPYRGCTFGGRLCGVSCYVQHNHWITQGRAWGQFLEIRHNAADSYERSYCRERAWARQNRGDFSIFCSSSTDPFLPQERQYGVTAALLERMCQFPPDVLILQTHSPTVLDHIDVLQKLNSLTSVRVHLTIEGDRDRLPGLPPPVATVGRRIEAVKRLNRAGLRTVVTVAPLHPIEHPERFFAHLADAADAIVIDHFIGGDGSKNGSRTRKTPLFEVMRSVDERSVELEYRDQMVAVAEQFAPGRVGVGEAGFAGQYLAEQSPGNTDKG